LYVACCGQQQQAMQMQPNNMRNSQSSPNLSMDSPSMARPQQQQTSFTPPPKSRANSDGFSAPKAGEKPAAGAFSPPMYRYASGHTKEGVRDGAEATKGEPRARDSVSTGEEPK
jgi:hypothetical protein